MFEWLFRKKEKPGKVSLIGTNVSVTPEKITFEHQLLINGKVTLDVEGTGGKSMLYVSELGLVEGNVQAKNVSIAGKVMGNVQAQETVELALEGEVVGDVDCANLIQRDKGKVRGNVRAKERDV